MVSPYEKGRLAEQYIKKKLYADGAKLVLRSAKSKSPVDLISFNPDKGIIKLVQVKSGKAPSSLSSLMREYKNLIDLEGTYKVEVVFMVKKGRTFEAISIP